MVLWPLPAARALGATDEVVLGCGVTGKIVEARGAALSVEENTNQLRVAYTAVRRPPHFPEAACHEWQHDRHGDYAYKSLRVERHKPGCDHDEQRNQRHPEARTPRPQKSPSHLSRNGSVVLGRKKSGRDSALLLNRTFYELPGGIAYHGVAVGEAGGNLLPVLLAVSDALAFAFFFAMLETSGRAARHATGRADELYHHPPRRRAAVDARAPNERIPRVPAKTDRRSYRDRASQTCAPGAMNTITAKAPPCRNLARRALRLC